MHQTIEKMRLATLLLLPIAMTAASVQTVPHVDLDRYAGRWYEIARFPNRFQRDCAGNVSATYTLEPGGKITVLNECDTAQGKRKQAKGTAKLVDPKGP